MYGDTSGALAYLGNIFNGGAVRQVIGAVLAPKKKNENIPNETTTQRALQLSSGWLYYGVQGFAPVVYLLRKKIYI